MKKPSVIDIKIGRRTYAEDASSQKKSSMMKKSLDSSSHLLAFRISGMKVYSLQKRKYINFDKIRCRDVVSKTPESVALGLDAFFSELDSVQRTNLVKGILETLEALYKDFSELSVTLYSSSLLIAFDSPAPSNEASIAVGSSDAPFSVPFIVKIIDFAHSQWEENSSIPEDYLEGLQNIIAHLKRYL